jgi:hypothetical protein
VVTNIGEHDIPIKLGVDGDHVIALQFFDVQESTPRRAIGDIQPRSQGVVFFEDLTKMKAEFDSVASDSQRTRRATELVVEFGVFLVALTVLGAIASFLLTAVASGPAVENTVDAVNELDPDRWEAIVVLGALTVIAVTCLVWLSVGVCRLFRQVARRPRERDVPGEGELAG